MRSGLRVVLAAAACALTLTGCRAEVATTVEVTGEETAVIEVSAVFTDEAAAALAQSTQARTGLVDLFEARTGSAPKTTVSEDRFTATVTLPYERVGDLAEVTGVRSLSLDEAGTVTRVEFGPATKLVDTVREQNSNEPDGAALSATMLANTFLVVRVRYAGGVDSAVVLDGDGEVVEGVEVSTSDETATFTRTAAQDAGAGEFVVSGDVNGSGVRNLLLGAGALLLLVAGVRSLRRR